MNRLSAYITAFLLLGYVLNGQAQNIQAKLSLDKEEIKIGEHVKAELEVRFDVTDQVTMPLLKDTLTGNIEIVFADSVAVTYEGSNLGTKVMHQQLILTSFDTGFHAIPPIVFRGLKDSARTEAYLLHVKDVPVEMGQSEEELNIKDIKDIEEVPFSFLEWFKDYYIWFVLGILIIIALIAYIKYLHPMLFNKDRPIISMERKIPPHEIAMKQLAELKDKKLWQQGRFKDYHIELSDIVRNYIELRYEVPAMESTTSEILEDLAVFSLPKQIKGELKASLEIADLVKFAKHSPLPDENSRSFEAAEQFVKQTKVEAEESEHDANTELNQDV